MIHRICSNLVGKSKRVLVVQEEPMDLYSYDLLQSSFEIGGDGTYTNEMGLVFILINNNLASYIPLRKFR